MNVVTMANATVTSQYAISTEFIPKYPSLQSFQMNKKYMYKRITDFLYIYLTYDKCCL